ncbi:MAG: M15 family metallopeptidase [Pseudomonadota bacterium]
MTSSLAIEALATCPEFRHLSTIAGIRVDLRYATADNFVGRDLYSPFDCAWLHRDAAVAVERVVAWLVVRRPGATVLILDALRPQRVQEQLWDALDGTDLRGYLAEPSRGSIHSFGMAVDITLQDEAGAEFDMGTGFDDLSDRSQPMREPEMLARGEITQVHIDNRRLLRDAMAHAGFVGINSEWWHFDFGDRDQVRRTYRRIL